MAKINEIVEHVITRETKQLEEKIAQAQAAADAKLAETRKFLEEDLVNRKAEIDVQTDKQYQIEKNSLGIEMRDRILQQKQSLLSQVFTTARQELEAIAPEQFHAFLKDVLQQFVGETDSVITLTMGEKTTHLLDHEIVEKLNVESLNVKLSDEVIPNSSGFILSTQTAQYNFLFDSLIDDARDRLIMEIAQYFRSE